MKIFKKGITHGGLFHADDVFSTAMLKMVDPDFTVQRVLEVPDCCNEDDYIIYDIGRGKYDHHGEAVKYHENGMMYASFGLLWDDYGVYLSGSERAKQRIEKDFISVIDDADNGGVLDLVSMAVSAYNPSWNSSDNTDDAFAEAVDMAYGILTNLIRREKAIEEADQEVMEAYGEMKDKIVILKRFAPWSKLLADTEAEFVVFPSMRGGFNVQGVPLNSETRELKVPFPESWRGLENEQLERVSRIKGINFCHRSGFLVSAVSVEAALSAVVRTRKLLQQN